MEFRWQFHTVGTNGITKRFWASPQLIAELQRAKRASGAPWVRIFGKPMRPRKFGAYARTPSRTDSQGGGVGVPRRSDWGWGGGREIDWGRWGADECHLYLSLCTYINRAYNFDIHVDMINWQLSKQSIRWAVSRDHIAGSHVELIEVTCFLEVDRWPDDDFLVDRGLKYWFYTIFLIIA